MRRRFQHHLLYPLLALLYLMVPVVLRAQTASLDEGSYRLLKAGHEVGTERFTIRQSGTGDEAVIIAQGTVTLDTANVAEQVSSKLQVGGRTLRPAAYEVKVQGPDREQIAGRVIGGRFSARILSTNGEHMREYVASNGAVLVDEGVTHHHYFLARRIASGARRVPVIIPRENRQVSAEVVERGRESIRIGSRSVQARHLVVTITGAPERHLWVDEQSRVLRLEIPNRGYEAVRTAVPR